MAGNAAAVEELASRVDQSQVNLAEALAWRAVLARRAGDEPAAGHLFHRATARMGRLRRPPTRDYFDALCRYHETGGDLIRALHVRDRELAILKETGQLAYECRVRVERCRLLAQLGQLTEADRAAAREAARKLKRPEKWLWEIDTAV